MTEGKVVKTRSVPLVHIVNYQKPTVHYVGFPFPPGNSDPWDLIIWYLLTKQVGIGWFRNLVRKAASPCHRAIGVLLDRTRWKQTIKWNYDVQSSKCSNNALMIGKAAESIRSNFLPVLASIANVTWLLWTMKAAQNFQPTPRGRFSEYTEIFMHLLYLSRTPLMTRYRHFSTCKVIIPDWGIGRDFGVRSTEKLKAAMTRSLKWCAGEWANYWECQPPRMRKLPANTEHHQLR